MIGLIPAAGTATRLDGLPKFLLPIAEGHLLSRLVEQMRTAGAESIWIGANKHNAAFIKPYAPDGCTISGKLETATMCETVLAARAFCGDEIVLCGMPDTYWTERYVYERLVNRLDEFGADVAVACWFMRDDQRGKLGSVSWRNDRITDVIDKDPASPYEFAWGALAWKSVFWEHIQPEQNNIGLSLRSAVDAGLKVWAVPIQGDYYDCGTREEYFRLCGQLLNEVVYG